MKILGVDEQSRQGGVLKNEMRKIGFRLSELEWVDTIPEEGEGWYMLFGSGPLKEFCGDVKMNDVSGTLLHCVYNPDALIVPNYAPGYIYHNPELKPLWIDNIVQGFLFYQLDVKGVVA